MDGAVSSVQPPSDDLPAASSIVFSTSSASIGRPAAADSRLLCIPDHELLRPIASGAYGEVWLARNAVGTLRAVKIVRRDQHTSAESFEREFKGLQRFEPVSRACEGFVDILTLGLLPDGAGFYYVMELADGIAQRSERVMDPWSDARDEGSQHATTPPLHYPNYYLPRTLRADLKSRSALPADEVIVLGLKLTAALAHLHAQGLVHRDVKPSNILFIGDEPKLADAGLVAAVDDARSLVGTAGYIAPEGPGTPQADLYALGKVLYEVAFGKDRQEFPALPADVASRPDHAWLLELNSILLKACATDRRERYHSAEQIRVDLELLQHGKSLTRQRFWQRASSTAKKITIALGVLATAGSVTYFSRPKSVPLSKIGWSGNEEADSACREGWRVYHENRADSFKVAAGHYERAIVLATNCARAHARLVSAYVWPNPTDRNALEKARPHAERALLLDPRLDEAHVAMSTIMVLLTHDWSGAEREALEAIRLNPNSDENYYAYAGPLSIAGRHTEALAQVEKALPRSSPSFISEQFSAWVYLGARKYGKTIELINEIVARQTSDPQPSRRAYLTVSFLIPAYRERGDYRKAIELEEESERLTAKDPAAVKAKCDALRSAFEAGGPRGYWQTQLEWYKNDETDPVRLAILYARVGNKPKAFAYLDAAAEKAPLRLCFVLNREPAFDTLRGDSHFTTILKRFDLPH